MALWQWSTTAGNNANVGSINWAEGMPPSAVNNSARQMMADVADWTGNPGPEWYQHDAVTFASGTTFTIAGTDVTGTYLAGRRLRAVNSGGTIYGTVVSATFSTNTTVTAVWDSGSLDAGLSSLKIGVLAPGANNSIPTGLTPTFGNTKVDAGILTVSGSATVAIMNSNSNACYQKFSCSSGAKFIGVQTGGVFQIINSAGTTAIMSLTDAGSVTFTGDVTGTSDERLKDEWLAMPDDFVERLARVLSGSYLRTDMVPPQRQVGVGAQSLLESLPELTAAVHIDEKGIHSVAYGQAALVACVELAKEVRRLRQIMKKHGIAS